MMNTTTTVSPIAIPPPTPQQPVASAIMEAEDSSEEYLEDFDLEFGDEGSFGSGENDGVVVPNNTNTNFPHHPHHHHHHHASPSAVVVSSGGGYGLFWKCWQVGNFILLCLLFFMVLSEKTEVQTLEQDLKAEEAKVASLQEEVREKQETQIQELHHEVQQEQNFTFLIAAGTFTLLTCLISLFHMSSHLQRMNQPLIQRKVVAILWMSPIYSITSFLSLIFPPAEGYLAILKDFYESYCIYTFLSFLIAVLGKGSRSKAVEVLSMHAHHLERPFRCLSAFYDPPPETSDFALAKATITECQILCMQFVFIRPLTTVIWVVHEQLFASTSTSTYTTSSPVDNFMTTAPIMAPMPDQDLVGNGTRWLNIDNNTIDAVNATILGTILPTLAATTAPDVEMPPTFDDTPFPSSSPFVNNDTFITDAPTFAVIDVDDSSEESLSSATLAYFKSVQFILAMVVNISVFFAFWGLLKFYHAVCNDLAWCRPWPKFLTIKGIVFLTFWQGLIIVIAVHLSAEANGVSTHEVEDTEMEDPSAKAKRYQNLLICCEMLLFSLTHWCVFPAEEWEKNYTPPEKVNSPGIGIQDFVDDVGHIVNSGRQRRRHRGRKQSKSGKRRSSATQPGYYHQPETATAVVEANAIPDLLLQDDGDTGGVEEGRSPGTIPNETAMDSNDRNCSKSDDSSDDDMELL